MNIFILKSMRYLDNTELFTKDEMWENAYDAWAADAADAAAAVATYAVAAAARAEYWIDEYFRITEEDKQDYINEVERLK